MSCYQCQAPLRPDARFCNQCGARQEPIDQLPTAVPVPRTVVEYPALVSAAADSSGQMSTALDGGAGAGRVPRPPRIPRATETSAPRSPRPPDVSSPGHSTRDAGEFADAETMEYDVVLAREGGARTVPLPTRGEIIAEPTPTDGLPWPLPPSIIVGGRYRVESLLSTGPADHGAENVYLVSDLQGYERCWSCHAQHGPEAALLVACPECGADMLDRDYVLRERLLPATDAASADGVQRAQAANSTPGERYFAQGQRTYAVAARTDATPRFPQGVHVVAGVASDRGRRYPDEPNQDSQGLLLLELAADSHAAPLALGVVADGLGGHDSGLEASQLALRIVTESVLRSVTVPWLSGTGRLDGDALERALRAAVHEANTAVCDMNEARGSDAGSTVVAALIAGEMAYIANVGDSRAYALGREGLRRITTDHSLVEQLVASGAITEDERFEHPQRNQILRSLGERKLEVDLFTLKLRPGMRLLLCSDGLWEMVRYDEMARILGANSHPQEACAALVRAANAHGGDDNVSALVIEAHA